MHDMRLKAENALNSQEFTTAELVIHELPGRPVVTTTQEQNNDQREEREDYEENNAEANLEDRFLLIKTSHIPILALCGLLADLASGAGLLDDVLKEAQIKAFRGFSLKFRMNKGITKLHDREYIEVL